MDARDAFVYYDLKTGGESEIREIGSHKLLLKCGTDFFEQGKYDLAEACFANILTNAPDDYRIWKLRAFNWESRVVNDFKKSFYEYTPRGGLTEKKEYMDKYREFCDSAVRYCPGDMADGLAEEFNDRIRNHFDFAYRAYKLDRRRSAAFAAFSAASLFALAAVALRSCVR